jgi:hypothetical protein
LQGDDVFKLVDKLRKGDGKTKGLGARFAWYESKKLNQFTCSALDGNSANLVTELSYLIVEQYNTLEKTDQQKSDFAHLWDSWKEISSTFKSIILSPQNIQELENKIAMFGKLYTGIFGDSAVTPYIHLVVCHVVSQCKKLESMQIASQQKFERFHSITKELFYRATTRGGLGRSATKDTIAAIYVRRIMDGRKFKNNVSAFRKWLTKHRQIITSSLLYKEK